MAFPTSVNPQITDAVTQANVKVLGDAPAIAMGQLYQATAQALANVKVLGDAPALAMVNLYQATAQALANAAHNATSAQQQDSIAAQAATTMGVTTLYSIDTASDGIATSKIFGS